MRVMLDTNVLISALLFPSSQMEQLFRVISSEHTLVLSSYVIDEMHRVVSRKFPTKLAALENFLSRLSYELVYTPKIIEKQLCEIRDPADYPVLHSALTEGIDIFLTGDKDFQNLEIDYPVILTPSEFLEQNSK